MSRLEEIVDIYKKVDEITTIGLKANAGDKELQKIVALTDIAQSLRDIDITLAMLLDDKKGAGE